MLNLAMKDDYRSGIEKIDRINNDELLKITKYLSTLSYIKILCYMVAKVAIMHSQLIK